MKLRSLQPRPAAAGRKAVPEKKAAGIFMSLAGELDGPLLCGDVAGGLHKAPGRASQCPADHGGCGHTYANYQEANRAS